MFILIYHLQHGILILSYLSWYIHLSIQHAHIMFKQIQYIYITDPAIWWFLLLFYRVYFTECYICQIEQNTHTHTHTHIYQFHIHYTIWKVYIIWWKCILKICPIGFLLNRNIYSNSGPLCWDMLFMYL